MFDETHENTYVIDPRSEAELVRVARQATLLNNHVGLLPEGFVPREETMILDLACGPGGWVLDLVDQFPQIRAIGVDLNELMVAFAQAQAKVQGKKRVRFQRMNILSPLDFPRDSFDLVHARFLVGLMLCSMWPILIRECFRITKPHGMICLTEPEPLDLVGSPLLQRMDDLLVTAFWKAQMAFSDRGYALTPMLGQILGQEGYQVLQEKSSVLNLSFGTEAYIAWKFSMPASMELTKPFVLKYNTMTSEEYDDLSQGVLREIADKAFQAYWPVTSIIGKKPGECAVDQK